MLCGHETSSHPCLLGAMAAVRRENVRRPRWIGKDGAAVRQTTTAGPLKVKERALVGLIICESVGISWARAKERPKQSIAFPPFQG